MNSMFVISSLWFYINAPKNYNEWLQTNICLDVSWYYLNYIKNLLKVYLNHLLHL